MRIVDSGDVQHKSKQEMKESAIAAQVGITSLPYAYNRHPEMRERVLIYYLVQEFLESMQLYSTLAVFSRESAFDSRDYAEYHPMMGMEWFLQSFFMGDRYDGLLPIVMRFYKSAHKRVMKRRKENEELDDMVQRAEVEEAERVEREKSSRRCPQVVDGATFLRTKSVSCSNPVCPQVIDPPPPSICNRSSRVCPF